jgi:hypothetical protein
MVSPAPGRKRRRQSPGMSTSAQHRPERALPAFSSTPPANAAHARSAGGFALAETTPATAARLAPRSARPRAPPGSGDGARDRAPAATAAPGGEPVALALGFGVRSARQLRQARLQVERCSCGAEQAQLGGFRVCSFTSSGPGAYASSRPTAASHRRKFTAPTTSSRRLCRARRPRRAQRHGSGPCGWIHPQLRGRMPQVRREQPKGCAVEGARARCAPGRAPGASGTLSRTPPARAHPPRPRGAAERGFERGRGTSLAGCTAPGPREHRRRSATRPPGRAAGHCCITTRQRRQEREEQRRAVGVVQARQRHEEQPREPRRRAWAGCTAAAARA